MVHYEISNRGSQVLIFYLLVFDRIHDAMYLNKMSRTSGTKTGPQHYGSSHIFKCGHGVLFYPCLHQTHLVGLLPKSSFVMFHLTIEASAV